MQVLSQHCTIHRNTLAQQGYCTLDFPELGPRPPLVCAHGGDTSAAPPNTKQAFLAAIAAHADCVEVDCARTSDGVLVVLHTRELQQLLGKRFVPGTQVGDLTSDEIRQLAWPGGQPVLSVRDAVLLTSPQVECVTLDVKTYQDSTGKAVDSEQVAAAVVQLVHDTRCSNCLVWAKTDEALSPGQRAGFILMNETADARAAGMHLPLRLQAAEVVGAHHAMVDEVTLQLLRTHGKQLFTWTINDPKVMRRVLDVGVDALVTNKLAQAQEAIEWRMQLCGSVRG
ncbi:GP-PDE domain-containing protein, partial [Haematococcus lacustris]